MKKGSKVRITRIDAIDRQCQPNLHKGDIGIVKLVGTAGCHIRVNNEGFYVETSQIEEIEE